jgi:hypothetical protein
MLAVAGLLEVAIQKLPPRKKNIECAAVQIMKTTFQDSGLSCEAQAAQITTSQISSTRLERSGLIYQSLPTQPRATPTVTIFRTTRQLLFVLPKASIPAFVLARSFEADARLEVAA